MSKLIILLLLGLLTLSSCGEKAADSKTANTEVTANKPAPTVVPTNTTANQPRQVDRPPSGTIQTPKGAPLGSITNPIMKNLNEVLYPGGNVPKPPAPKKPEPPQNAAGVWHYTCSSGCAGGAGSAVACKTCGTTLVHNQDYHK